MDKLRTCCSISESCSDIEVLTHTLRTGLHDIYCFSPCNNATVGAGLGLLSHVHVRIVAVFFDYDRGFERK